MYAPIGRALAEMSFGCPPAVTEALRDAVCRGDIGYLSETQSTAVAEAAAQWLEDEHAWRPPVPAIRPVADLVAGFRAVLEHFTDPSDAIIVPTPAYMPFLSVPPTLGRTVIEVPMRRTAGGWHYDLDAIRDAFARGGRLLVLCNPHNPIGKVADAAELAGLEELVHEAGGLVFADEIHAPVIFGGRSHLVYAAQSARAAAHTITATSASKAFNIPGVKCGQLVFTNPAHLERWRRIGRWYEHQTSSLGVAATIAAYRSGRPWLDEIVDYLDGTIIEATTLLTEAGAGDRCLRPDATYLLWIDLRGTVVDAEASLADSLYERTRLVVIDGSECGHAAEGFVRFNAALPRENVREAMHRLAEVLGQAGPLEM